MFSTQKDGAPHSTPIDVMNIPDAVPKKESYSQTGNPHSYIVGQKRYYVLPDNKDYVQRGTASWYGTKFHGRATSSGEVYDMYAMTAAHKTLPLPTYAEVENLENNTKIIVKINDRGPFKDNRIIDLSFAAAAKLGILDKGTGNVEVRAIDPETYYEVEEIREIEKKLTTEDGIYIQAGAFANRDNAERMKVQLHSIINEKVSIIASESESPAIYRVRIGPIDNAENAESVSEILLAKGLSDPVIIND